MDNREVDEALRAYTEGEVTLVDAVNGYAESVQQAADVLGIELAGLDIDTVAEPARLLLRLAADPGLRIEWNLALGWLHTPIPTAGLALGEPHEITYRAGDEGDAANLAPDADVVAAWLAVLATGDRSGHQEPPERPAPDDPGLLAQLATHARRRGLPGASSTDV